MVGITCGICGYSGDAEEFTPERTCQDDPDWRCPECLCGVFVPVTVVPSDFFEVTDGSV